ncbi:MAG: glycosyltransferase family 2 protein [Acidobacteria bacterium]|nr:glycosyltransferase family 2 protein [Acidobacteriota bacterium]MCA1640391.1 glycosyltransferase family 2 protein [Acidobacteriota bacterium]
MRTPVAFIIFNRPEVTARVFAEIARARPEKLLVVADGARDGRPGEREACEQTRAVVERVDWDCEVLENFSDVNLGCRRRVASGITWVFEQVEEAIILEDDCVPHPSFFPFCEEILERFREDERVMMVSGDNFQFGHRRTPYSYYFSRMAHIWGWASWRRAWRHYDVGMKLWDDLRDTPWLLDLFGDAEVAALWRTIFDKTRAGFNTWDYQWAFACWTQHALAVLPERNLISNIGFGAMATHTKAVSREANIPVEAMEFPLRHPPYMVHNREAATT